MGKPRNHLVARKRVQGAPCRVGGSTTILFRRQKRRVQASLKVPPPPPDSSVAGLPQNDTSSRPCLWETLPAARSAGDGVPCRGFGGDPRRRIEGGWVGQTQPILGAQKRRVQGAPCRGREGGSDTILLWHPKGRVQGAPWCRGQRSLLGVSGENPLNSHLPLLPYAGEGGPRGMRVIQGGAWRGGGTQPKQIGPRTKVHIEDGTRGLIIERQCIS